MEEEAHKPTPATQPVDNSPAASLREVRII